MNEEQLQKIKDAEMKVYDLIVAVNRGLATTEDISISLFNINEDLLSVIVPELEDTE